MNSKGPLVSCRSFLKIMTTYRKKCNLFEISKWGLVFFIIIELDYGKIWKALSLMVKTMVSG